MMKLTLMTIFLLAGAPAMAHEEPAGASVRVSTTDLDLTTAKGRVALDRRLNAAVDQVCMGREEFRSPRWTANVRCRRVAADGVRQQRERILTATAARTERNIVASR